MRRLSSRHIFAGIILLLELPILAPIVFGAIVTGLIAIIADRLTALRTTLVNLPVPDITVRHQHTASI